MGGGRDPVTEVFDATKKTIEEGGKALGAVGRAAYEGTTELTSGKSFQRLGGMVEGAGKNVERNVGNILGDFKYAVSTGNFNNIGRSLSEAALAVYTGGASLAVNPDDTEKVMGETSVQRATREGEMKAAEEKQAAKLALEAAKEAERLEGIRTAIDQSIMARLRTPGRAQVSGSLLTGPATGGTLLTTRGK